MSLGRLFKDLRFHLFYWWLTQPAGGTCRYGTECQWTICESGLTAASHILCAGAGHDISFEAALTKRFGGRVILLDPSPTGIATVEKCGLPAPALRFLPVGLAGRDGTLNFAPPCDAAEGSFRGGQAEAAAAFQFPCRSLASLMREFGWQHIDLLKMDIEGCEYEVIAEILAQRLDVRQICVEFHHGPAFGRPRGEMVRALLRLRRAGYQLIHHIHQDHTFVRR